MTDKELGAEPGATYCQEPGQALIPVCCKSYSNVSRPQLKLTNRYQVN